MNLLLLKIGLVVMLCTLCVPMRYKPILSFFTTLLFITESTYWAISAYQNFIYTNPITSVPFIGEITVRLDRISVLFIAIINMLAFTGGIYSLTEYKKFSQAAPANLYFIFHNILHLACIFICSYDLLIPFLVVWEIMSLSSFILLFKTDSKEKNILNGLNYLVQMHIGSVILIIATIILYQYTGKMSFEALSMLHNKKELYMLVVLFVCGFSFKAGIFPFHTWLPDVYRGTTSRVAAFMSAGLLKLGIFGIIRVLMYMRNLELECGIILLTIGLVSALYGIFNSSIQNSLTRVLAYSSLENVGIIISGLGLGFIGIGVKDAKLSYLGFLAAFNHIFSHSMSKAVLFYLHGSILDTTGTSDLNKLGGLAKKMPVLSILFLIGCIMITGMPIFHSFDTEFFLINGIFHGLNASYVTSEVLLVIALIGLLLTGGFSVYSFARAYSMIFLGSPRTPDLTIIAQPRYTMGLVAAMITVAVAFIFNVCPVIYYHFINNTTHHFKPSLAVDVEYYDVLIFNISLVLAALLGFILLLYLIKRRLQKNVPLEYNHTWGCGYTAPNTRMQYTPASFGKNVSDFFNPFVDHEIVEGREKIQEIFPKDKTFVTIRQDKVKSRVIDRVIEGLEKLLLKAAIIQTGKLQHYVLYTLVTVLSILVLTVLDIL